MPEFDGLGGFIAFLPALAARVAAAEQRGRADAVEIVRQAVVGTFDGADWPDLAPATQVARARLGLSADRPEVATGALRNSITGTVTLDGRAAVGVADAMVGSGQPGDPFRNIGDVAVAQEEGTGTIPERSFLGLGGFRAAEPAATAFAAAVVAALAGAPQNSPAEGDAVHGDD